MISKKTIEETLSREDSEDIKKLERDIDDAIKSKYNGIGSSVRVELSSWPRVKVQQEIKKLFAEGNWSLSFESSTHPMQTENVYWITVR